MMLSLSVAESKDWRTSKIVPDLYRKCILPYPFKIKDSRPSTSSFAAPEAKRECRNYESVIRAEELRIPIVMTALHEPPSSTDKNLVDLLFHPAYVGIPTHPT